MKRGEIVRTLRLTIPIEMNGNTLSELEFFAPTGETFFALDRANEANSAARAPDDFRSTTGALLSALTGVSEKALGRLSFMTDGEEPGKDEG